jgi:signal transduction histidine kinase
MTLAAASWQDAITERPLDAALAGVLLIAATVVCGLALRSFMRRSRSLRRQVLAITLAAVAIGATAAIALARLMVLDGGELRTVVAVLGVTALFATLLVLISSGPLGRDVRRLEATVRAVEAGNRQVRTEVVRADELGLAAHAIDELTARLDALEREQAGYEAERALLLSSVGHDLRTPLAALQAALEAVADNVAPDPDRYVRSMQRDVEVLAGLVDDLFLLARIEAGKVEVDAARVDLAEIADESIEALAPVAAGRGVTVRVEGARCVPVHGSHLALGRVLRNLLDNAIRHAPPGSTVRVRIDDGPQPVVRVVDEGEGFPVTFLAHAFDRFSRADQSRTRTTGGAGLGLAIARGLVEAHGGRIWIEDAPGGRVAFALPAA